MRTDQESPKPARWQAHQRRLRQIQSTGLWLAIVCGIGLTAGWLTQQLGAPIGTAQLVGLCATLAMVALLAVPVRYVDQRTLDVPGDPGRVFALTVDPREVPALSSVPADLISVVGTPGAVGSSYEVSADRVMGTVRVLSSDPPNEIVTETRSRLGRVITRRRYSAIAGGTKVSVRHESYVTLAQWLIRPIFQAEVRLMRQESDRRLRARLSEPLS